MKVFLKKFLALIDTPAAFVGQALKLVQVNSAEDALEFTNEIVGPIQVRNLVESNGVNGMNEVTPLVGEIAWTSDHKQIRLGDGVQEGGYAGNMASSAMILCPAIGTPVENAARLRALYTEAKTYTPGGSALSATNRVVIHLGTGTYDFELGDVADLNHGLELDTQFIDLAGITGLPADVILTSAIATASRGTVEQTADDVRLSGFTIDLGASPGGSPSLTRSSAYFPATNLPNTKLTDIICSSANSGASMRTYIAYAGTYTRVLGDNYAFGYYGVLSGDCIDCSGGSSSFATYGTLSGTCTRGFALTESYGANGVISGEVLDSVGATFSFAYSGTISGTCTRCTGGQLSWGTLTASGLLYDCLLDTGSGAHAYLPENVKRKNDTYSPSETGKDLTALHTITWTNPTPNAIKVEPDLVLSNLDTGVETFSVQVTSAAGSNSFTSTKAAGEATHTIHFPTYLGSVAIAGDYVITIISDNASQTNVSDTLNITVMAVV